MALRGSQAESGTPPPAKVIKTEDVMTRVKTEDIRRNESAANWASNGHLNSHVEYQTSPPTPPHEETRFSPEYDRQSPSAPPTR